MSRPCSRTTIWWLAGFLWLPCSLAWHWRSLSILSDFCWTWWVPYIAVWMLTLRGEVKELWWSIRLLCWIQVVVVAWQLTGHHTPWSHAGSGWVGTLGKRSSLAALWGLWACASPRMGGLGWGCLSLSTTSSTGALPWLLRLRWLSLPCLAMGAWLLRHSLSWQTRWMVWSDALAAWWQTSRVRWFGIGQAVLPGGFRDDTQLGAHLAWRDYHSSLLECLMRTGLWGTISLLILLGAVVWVAWQQGSRARLLVGWLLWTLSVQSVAEQPALLVLVAVVVVTILTEVTHVAPVSQLAPTRTQ